MSYHHENIVWQSADGSWSRGFYERIPGFRSSGDDDYDSEWDDEFDYGVFEWVSAGHSTANEAAAAWDGSNPGGYSECAYGDETAERIDRLDDMAAVLCEAEARRKVDRWGWSRYNGTPKRRKTVFVQAQRDSIIEAWVSTRARGYDNLFDPGRDLPRLDADLVGRYQQASIAERAAYDERDTAHRAKLRDLLAKARQDYVDSNRGSFRYSYDRDRGQKRSDCFAEVEKYLDKLDAAAARRLSTAKPKAAPAGSTRAKTTAKSTAGSFAPHHRSEADVDTVLG